MRTWWPAWETFTPTRPCSKRGSSSPQPGRVSSAKAHQLYKAVRRVLDRAVDRVARPCDYLDIEGRPGAFLASCILPARRRTLPAMRIRCGASWSEGQQPLFADADRDRALPPKCAGRRNPVIAIRGMIVGRASLGKSRRYRLGLQLTILLPPQERAGPIRGRTGEPAEQRCGTPRRTRARPDSIPRRLARALRWHSRKADGLEACDRAVNSAAALSEPRHGSARGLKPLRSLVSASNADRDQCLRRRSSSHPSRPDPFTAPTPGGRALETPLVDAAMEARNRPRSWVRNGAGYGPVLSPEMKTEADLFADSGVMAR